MMLKHISRVMHFVLSRLHASTKLKIQTIKSEWRTILEARWFKYRSLNYCLSMPQCSSGSSCRSFDIRSKKCHFKFACGIIQGAPKKNVRKMSYSWITSFIAQWDHSLPVDIAILLSSHWIESISPNARKR